MPIVARPGEVGALALPGHYESYLAIAGPTWRNEIDAVGRPRARLPPARQGTRSRCAARCWCRSPTSTAAPRRGPPPRRPRPAGPRSGTTPATTSTSGRAATGSSRRWPTSASCGGRLRAGQVHRVPGERRISDRSRMPRTRRLSNLDPVAIVDHEQTELTDPHALTRQRFERMTLVGGDGLPAVDTAGLPDGPSWPAFVQTIVAAEVPALVPPLPAQEVRRRLHRAADAQGPAAGLLHQAGAREGDLRRRPRGLPRRQGQRDPRPGHGRALAAAPGRRRAQAGPQAADAGVQRPRAARATRTWSPRSPATRSRTGRTASSSGPTTG